VRKKRYHGLRRSSRGENPNGTDRRKPKGLDTVRYYSTLGGGGRISDEGKREDVRGKAKRVTAQRPTRKGGYLSSEIHWRREAGKKERL